MVPVLAQNFRGAETTFLLEVVPEIWRVVPIILACVNGVLIGVNCVPVRTVSE